MDESIVKELEQQADLRAIFERVKAHLLAQNCQSVDKEAECAYRGAEGLRCAVGVLITDRHYSRWFEGSAADDKNVVRALALSGVSVAQQHIGLLLRLQNLHDQVLPSHWPAAFDQIEKDYFPA
jgi:hypothetical protein